MKSQVITLIALLAIIAFGCQSENVKPKTTSTPTLSLAGHEGHDRPSNQCGASHFTDLVDAGGTIYGSIEVLNDEENVYILSTMNHGWLLRGVKVYGGASVDIPKAYGGTIQIEEFPFQFNHPRRVSQFTYIVPKGALANCTEFSVYAIAEQVDFFGNTLDTEYLWAEGTQVLDGQAFSYCMGVCAPTPVNMASMVD